MTVCNRQKASTIICIISALYVAFTTILVILNRSVDSIDLEKRYPGSSVHNLVQWGVSGSSST